MIESVTKEWKKKARDARGKYSFIYLFISYICDVFSGTIYGWNYTASGHVTANCGIE
jgi:hypothetical protein